MQVTATTMLMSRQLPVHLALPPPQLALPLPLELSLLHSEDLLVHAARPPLFVLGSLSVPRCGRGDIGAGGSALALT